MTRAKPPSWASRYVGQPFVDRGRDREKGLDCYGLVRLVLAEQSSLIIPAHGDCGEIDDKDGQSFAMDSLRSQSPWVEVLKGTERVFDVAEITEVFRRPDGSCISGGYHMGVVVAPGWMLHTRRATDARLERYDRPPWKSRIARFWRWSR